MRKTLAILLLAGTTFFSGCGEHTDIDLSTLVAPPICADDAYATNSNTQLVVASTNGVLANDTPNGAGITYDGTSANGGTVVGLADGGFTYTPAANFVGDDTFAYTLGNSAGSMTCTVTITVSAVNGYFVDSVNGSDATGSFTNGAPYATIQTAAADAPAGSDIVVRPGNYTGTVTLENGDRLLGSGSVLAQGVVPRPVLTGPVVLADGNTLDFLRIDGTAGDAVDGNGQTGGIVTNCEIANTTANGRGVAVMPGAGTWTIDSNTISNVTGLGVQLTTDNALQMTATVNNNTITGSGFNAIGLTSDNTSQLTIQVNNNTMTGNAAGVTFEALVGDTSTFCLDLENNTNDDVYQFSVQNTATANVEQFSTLAAQQVSGTVQVSTGGFFANPTEVADGFCGF